MHTIFIKFYSMLNHKTQEVNQISRKGLFFNLIV
jgi:hypothetical protein